MIFVDTSFFVALLDPQDTNHPRAVEAFQAFQGKRLSELLLTTKEAAGFAYLQKHADKEYSAADCLSFAVMEKLGIYEALAFDSDFGHRFVMRPGPKTG